MVKHKRSFQARRTVCGIRYDDIKDLGSFISKKTVSHWRNVDCKSCIRGRRDYELRTQSMKYKIKAM